MKRISIYLFFFVFLCFVGCQQIPFQQEAFYEGGIFYVDDLESWNKIKDKSIDEIVDCVSSLSCRNLSEISDDDYEMMYKKTMSIYPDIYRLDDTDLVKIRKMFPSVRTKEDVEVQFAQIEPILTKMITYDFCKRQSEMRFSSRGYSSFINDKQRDLMNRNVKYIGGTLTGSVIARNEAKSNYRGKSDWQTKADAFRHGCWHSFIVYSTGYTCRSVAEALDWADRFVEAHEDGVRNLDTVMDIHNNAFSAKYTRSVAYKKGVSVKMPKRKEIVSYVKKYSDSAIYATTVEQIEKVETGKLVYIAEFKNENEYQ